MSSSNHTQLWTVGAIAAGAYLFRSQIFSALGITTTTPATSATIPGSADDPYGYSCVQADGSNDCITPVTPIPTSAAVPTVQASGGAPPVNPVQTATAVATAIQASGGTPLQAAVAAQQAATTSSGYSIVGSSLIDPTGAVVPTPAVYTPPARPADGGATTYTFGDQTGLTAAQTYDAQIATLNANAAATPAPPGYVFTAFGGLQKIADPVPAATAAATTVQASGGTPQQAAVAAQQAATTSTGYSIVAGNLIAPSGAVIPTPAVYTPPPPPPAGGDAIYTFGNQTGLTAAQLYAAQIAQLKANAAATPAPPGYTYTSSAGLQKIQ